VIVIRDTSSESVRTPPSGWWLLGAHGLSGIGDQRSSFVSYIFVRIDANLRGLVRPCHPFCSYGIDRVPVT
jgi:hypothetical protein